MGSFIKYALPYGFSNGYFRINIKKTIKNFLPAIIVEKVNKKRYERRFTVDYLKRNYVSDLSDNEKWMLLAFLLKLERERNSVNYLEVGIYAGSTIRFLKENTNNIVFTGVDLFEDFLPSDDNTHMWKNYSIRQVEEALDSSRVFLHKGNSVDVLCRLQSENKKFDFIFIDGNHTYSATKSDYQAAMPLLNEGGYIAFHNCSPGLTQEDKYYVKLDGGPWLLTQELLYNNDLRFVEKTDRLKVFESIVR